MKLSNPEQIKLVQRMIAVRSAWNSKISYTNAYLEAFGKKNFNVDTIRNAWNLKGLSKNIDVIENFEKLVKTDLNA